MEPSDAFLQFASELADGERWKMLRADDGLEALIDWLRTLRSERR